ncbi:MAG: nascent polypeptide-associated complex protein [Candidatus Aenigmarchaeota archaeon]|nr:nascent polypeptide-associated complex protein [Candidatus Aenigmarchaeota archaeon]
MKLNPKHMEKLAKQMGIKMDPIEAEEVIIRTPEREIIIQNPQVARVNMMGQETFQISGDIVERPKEKFSEDDVKLIMEKTGASREKARQALEETGGIAEAIMKLRG